MSTSEWPSVDQATAAGAARRRDMDDVPDLPLMTEEEAKLHLAVQDVVGGGLLTDEARRGEVTYVMTRVATPSGGSGSGSGPAVPPDADARILQGMGAPTPQMGAPPPQMGAPPGGMPPRGAPGAAPQMGMPPPHMGAPRGVPRMMPPPGAYGYAAQQMGAPPPPMMGAPPGGPGVAPPMQARRSHRAPRTPQAPRHLRSPAPQQL